MTSDMKDPQGSPQGPNSSTPNSSRPTVFVGDRTVDALTEKTIEAMVRANTPDPSVFVVGGALSLVRTDGEAPYLERLDRDRLRNYLARTMVFKTIKGKKKVIHVDPPGNVVANILAEPGYPFPVIERVVTAPVFGKDGSLSIAPGYHASSRTFFAPPVGLVIPGLPEKPTAADVAEARALILDELLGDFPFLDESDRAMAVAAMMLPFVRSSIDGPTPMVLISAPVRGTGKTLLATVLIFPTTGGEHGVQTEAKGEEEWRKRIGSSLATGPPVVFIDNLLHWLGSAALAAVLTSPVWVDRRLGKNDESIRFPNRALWLATANNLSLSDEMVRRSVPIRLDAGVERPYERDPHGFRHQHLSGWVRNARSRLVRACLVLGRAWFAAGKPTGSRSMGSFENWAAVMGGILDVAGISGFLENLDAFRTEFDDETESWVTFIHAWWEQHGQHPVRVGDLLTIYEEGDDFLGIGTYNRNEKGRETALGRRLVGRRNAIYGGYRIDNPGKQHGGNLWRLIPTESKE